jgi:EAL domain-containing protein (putative c-di-GMP-specific phosphodiesterase class I)
LELEADLRRALQRDELVVHYQPTVQLTNGAITGFEALVRWEHPRRGLLSPLEFIPLAEETGLIIDIGRWVLDQACHQARQWQQTHATDDLTMSVNLSARQLRDPHLIADVAATLHATGLAPHCLVLEITETILMDHTEAAIEGLHQLKALGIRLAIDDFGTGYSSLNYLRALPVDIVKIDKVFIDGVASDKESRGLIKAILSMADTLDLQTVAEGVESRDQVNRLQQLGSALVQGFYYARPLTPEAAEALMTTGIAVEDDATPTRDASLSPRV